MSTQLSSSPDGRITAVPYRHIPAPTGAPTERQTDMAYVYLSTGMKGLTMEDFQKVSAEHLRAAYESAHPRARGPGPLSAP